MNNRLSVGGIFCDLEKAFDSVNHGIIVDKLKFHGNKGNFLVLIQCYLTGRYQNVLIDRFNACDDVYSRSSRRIINGVIQGSILGPLLLLFM